MNALDTNVLVRLLVNDDEAQCAKAKALCERAEVRGERLFVAIPVVLELFWTLRAVYDCPRADIIGALEQLTLTPLFAFEAPDRIRDLIDLGRKTALDPADILIGLTARDFGYEATLTFDRRATKSELFQRI